MAGWRDRQIERADKAHAEPFRARIKAKYRALRTSAELRALADECDRERRYAVKQANRYCNFTEHGTHLYDSYDYWAAAAEAFAGQFRDKAKRLDAGEPMAVVLPHTSRKITATHAGAVMAGTSCVTAGETAPNSHTA